MTDFVVRTGHQAKHMILKCEYSGDECFYSNFSHVNTHHGNCYTFNKWEEGRGPLISKRAGAGNGLKLILDIELEEYTPSNDLDGDSMDAGLKILIHPTNEPPYVKELGFALTPGYHSFISMKKELITGLPVPYGECLKDGNIQYHDHYSLSACRIECETLAVQTECGCRLVEQPGDLPVCTASQTHHCAHQTLVDFVDGHLDVDCSCADPCTVEDYPHVITMAKLRPAFIEKMFHDTEHNMTEEYIQENVIVLSIFYEGLNLQTITQLPDTDVIVLVSQIGGNMGLCLGASILTILELLEFALDYIASKCKLLVSRYQKRRIIHVKPAVEVNEEKKEIRPTVVN
ncbi:acid-sensing ion channel 1C-like [Ptychodera flava]|uniref:acid-sensing ion channel 1C-like n=1 Tax=Ptychodera flava TaxID=63121 RepID=UPI003969DA9C